MRLHRDDGSIKHVTTPVLSLSPSNIKGNWEYELDRTEEYYASHYFLRHKIIEKETGNMRLNIT